jgi:NitT/TauT family transport system permease protein
VKHRSSLFAVRGSLSPRAASIAKALAFILPLLAWCIVSYVPFVWHPQVRITAEGDSERYEAGQQMDRAGFMQENFLLAADHKAIMTGVPANPIFLPAPHAVAKAMFSAFMTPPARKQDPWLHQTLWTSCQVIFWGFAISALVAVPLGIVCGTFDVFSKLVEPFIDFVRYMPPPAFGALVVAVLGIDTAPKIAIIVIGTFFTTVLVVANTTRSLDSGLLEAAQTLGAKRRRLITHVVLPGVVPALYNDLRIMLGTAWVYLIVAELTGAASGISWFINQQGKYRHYDNVYAGIFIIGLIGLACDQVLAAVRPILFPWLPREHGANIMEVVARKVASLGRRHARAAGAAWANGRAANNAAGSPVRI